MDKFELELNDILVNTFNSILKVEELSMRKLSDITLSINEIHLIEMIGIAGENLPTISEIANKIGITLPSVTVAVKKLVVKGYVEKIKNQADARSVKICLTRSGHKVYNIHRFFHLKMIENISDSFLEEEKNTLIKAMEKLNEFFRLKIKALEN